MTTPPPHPPPPFQSHGVKTQYTGTLQRLCARLLPQARALRIAKQRPIDRLVRQPAWRRRGRTLAAAHTRGAHVLVCLQGCHAPVLSAVLRGGADATQHRRLVDAELVQRDACNRARACLARHRLRVSSQTKKGPSHCPPPSALSATHTGAGGDNGTDHNHTAWHFPTIPYLCDPMISTRTRTPAAGERG
jgi:hypothetical protein